MVKLVHQVIRPTPPPPTPPPSTQPPPLPANVKVAKQAVSENNSSSVDAAETAKKNAEKDADIARIKAENARKQKEYDEKVTKARNRAKELNQNLAGWYYVISNDIYEKIRLDKSSFIKIKKDNSSETPEEISASHILISYQGADRADAKIKRSKTSS